MQDPRQEINARALMDLEQRRNWYSWLFRNQYAGKNAFNGFTRLLAFWVILKCS